MSRGVNGFRYGSSLAALLVASMVGSVPAFAQSAAPAEVGEDNAEPASDIVVTGTRVTRDGYEAPTPTTVIGAADISAKAPTNVADFVNVLPSLAGSASPRANVSAASSGLTGINALNLRNLGPTRTLVLLDGQRVASSSLSGLVDVNTIPQALVKRVDIVTGGASASWGSDAVAGVVNFVLDNEFTGVKGLAQGGVTTYGDDRNFNLQLTVGSRFADDRGHFVLSGEIAHSDGIEGLGDRDWYDGSKVIFNPTYTATNGEPQLLVRQNVGYTAASPGGTITSGPLTGTYFGPGGTPLRLNTGTLVSGNFFVGGDWRYADFGTSGDLSPRLNRQSIFGRASFKLSDSTEIYLQSSYSRATSRVASNFQANLGNITIQRDNAFIPASIAPQVTASFRLGTFNQDLGPNIVSSERSSWRVVGGIKGEFAALGSDWNWDVSAQRSVNRILNEAYVTITPRFNAAIDAVRSPTGTIVCRSTLTNPTNGCVPYNVFGTGVNSSAVIDYVKGTSWGRTKLTQDVFAGTLRGEPFSTWAGPVSVAMGLEHRREGVSGSNDPLTTATSRPYFSGNYFASFGSYNVTEGFLETVVPLAKDSAFAKELDLSGAIRATDYSVSGYVTTWKLGLNYSPVEDITFRATRSRDIRAPNLAELFLAGQSQTSTFNDPFRGNATVQAQTLTRGNLALKPEKADSWGVGVVFQPAFLPGFAASVDYFDIRIDGAISTVAGATVVAQCFAGNTALCSQITRDAGGVITQVSVLPINLSRQVNRGIDFEASYRRQFLGGNVSLRLLASRYLENTTDNGINAPADSVGTNSQNITAATASGAGSTSLPKWRWLATFAWDRDPFAVSLSARGFSSGVYNPSYIQCLSACPTSTTDNTTIDNNRIPGATYLDGTVSFKFLGKFETFLAVDNIFNKDPVQVAPGPVFAGAPISVNPALYDTVGRTFRLGVRFKL